MVAGFPCRLQFTSETRVLLSQGFKLRLNLRSLNLERCNLIAFGLEFVPRPLFRRAPFSQHSISFDGHPFNCLFKLRWR